MELIEQDEKEISLTDVFLIFWKKRVLIVLLSFFGLVSGALFSWTESLFNLQVSTIVEYQWDGINQGEYPNGEPFDVNNAFSASTYGEIISELNLELTSPEIRNELTISPILPNDILAAIELALENGEDYVFYPTAFKYTLSLSPLNLGENKGKQLLNGLIEGFLEEFEQKYIVQNVVRSYAFDTIETYDYPDQVDVLASQVNLLNSSINRVLPQANAFISPILGIGFNDILAETTLLSTIDINVLDSLIRNNFLTKDAELYINRLEFQNTLLEVELAKQQQIRTDILSLIDSYPGSTTTIIIPGLDGSIETESYLETLYDNLLSVNVTIAGLEQDLAYNEVLITSYQNANNNESLIQLVENNIQRIYDSLTLLISQTNTMFSEYNRFLVKNIALVLVPATNSGPESLVLSMIIGILLGGTIGGSITLVQHSQKEYRKRIKSNKTA